MLKTLIFYSRKSFIFMLILYELYSFWCLDSLFSVVLECRYNGAKRTTFRSHFWINQEQQGGDCHIATSPRRDATKSRRRVNKCRSQQFSHVATLPNESNQLRLKRHQGHSTRSQVARIDEVSHSAQATPVRSAQVGTPPRPQRPEPSSSH